MRDKKTLTRSEHLENQKRRREQNAEYARKRRANMTEDAKKRESEKRLERYHKLRQSQKTEGKFKTSGPC